MCDELIKVGHYIIIQKQNYRKLHKFNKQDSSVTLGRDTVKLSAIENCKYSSTFKVIPAKSSNRNKEYYLELTEEATDLKDEISIKKSGSDNRNIFDDGRSQKLTASDIEVLRNDMDKASDIVESLITNSDTFHKKTEFSQEKYLRKKEKKYFDYLQVLKPNLRIVSDLMYKLDASKIQGIRIDTLSQIITLANICPEGRHLLYDSGSNGLLAAALLNAIGSDTTAKLIHMHPGNMSQKQALLAMNYKEEQLNRCISVNVYSVLRNIYQGTDTNDCLFTDHNSLKRKAKDDVAHVAKMPKGENDQKQEDNVSEATATNSEPKKPKWHFDNITASDLLKEKVDSLIIACKEDPLNLFNELVTFVKPGRPFVIYYNVAEPLQQLYMSLKSMSNVAALRLSCNWMRNYQVLPERTHPEVMMSASGGFLLSGYVLK